MLNNANGASVWTQLVQITALTTILGRLPGPSAQRWEESPFPGAEQPHSGPGISAGGDWRASAGEWGAGGGCWEGLLTLYFPPREDIPAGLGGRGRGVGGGPAPQHPLALGHPRKVSRLSNNLTS